MISEWSQLRRQQESEQHFMSSDFDLWDSNDTDVAEYYFFDSVNDSDFEVENIVTIDEKYWKVFVEIDTIVDQLSSEKLFRCYQEVFIWKMKWWAITEWELTLKSTESEEVINSYNNRF